MQLNGLIPGPLGAAEIRSRLLLLGLMPAPLGKPRGRFAQAQIHGDIAYVSSVTPVQADGSEICGRIGDDVGNEVGIQAARWCAANSLLALSENLPQDDRVLRPFDLLVFCSCVPGYGEQSIIADAASQVFFSVFPDVLPHTRAALGAASLVRNTTVVIKASYLLAK